MIYKFSALCYNKHTNNSKKGDKMKIRCKNCYRVLNPNEEYCTNCGEYSERMHRAMITGDYGPDPVGKFKMSFTLYALVGFALSGIFQIVFALIENKLNNGNGYTNLFCQTNSLFYSSIIATIVMLVSFRKDIKSYFPKINKNQIIGSAVVAVLTIAIVVIMSNLSDITLVLPKYVIQYLESGNAIFFDWQGVCIFKIAVGSILSSICLEILGRKYLIDALDETMLSDKAIYFITSVVVTIFEIAWIMSLEIAIASLIINLVSTGIYMYTNRNILINIIMRILNVLIVLIIFIL